MGVSKKRKSFDYLIARLLSCLSNQAMLGFSLLLAKPLSAERGQCKQIILSVWPMILSSISDSKIIIYDKRQIFSLFSLQVSPKCSSNYDLFYSPKHLQLLLLGFLLQMETNVSFLITIYQHIIRRQQSCFFLRTVQCEKTGITRRRSRGKCLQL